MFDGQCSALKSETPFFFGLVEPQTPVRASRDPPSPQHRDAGTSQKPRRSLHSVGMHEMLHRDRRVTCTGKSVSHVEYGDMEMGAEHV